MVESGTCEQTIGRFFLENTPMYTSHAVKCLPVLLDPHEDFPLIERLSAMRKEWSARRSVCSVLIIVIQTLLSASRSPSW